MDEHCEELASPSIWQFVISLFILVGILVSYLPQHYRIIARRSSAGLSPYFILLGTTSGTCAIANILILPTSHADLSCCKDISRFACSAALLGVAQVGVQWSCFFLIMLLFLIFFPRDGSENRPPTPPSEPAAPGWRDAVLVVCVATVHFFAVLMISIVLLAGFTKWLQAWANTLGIVAAFLAMTQYLPQIWTTWRIRSNLSLSIPMMLIQTPGSFVFATSLGVRLGRSGWSAWGVYVVTGFLQGVLLGMCLWFRRQERQRNRETSRGTTPRPGDGGTAQPVEPDDQEEEEEDALPQPPNEVVAEDTPLLNPPEASGSRENRSEGASGSALRYIQSANSKA